MQIDKIEKASVWRRSTHDSLAVPEGLPADYRAVVERLGPGEGFIGFDFLRLYPPDQLARLNEQYGFSEYLPGLLLFGSNGLGEAYAFDRNRKWEIVKTAFVPLDREYGERVATDLCELLERYARPAAPQYALDPETWQMEMEFRHPLALGGVADPGNRILVPPEKHVELVRFWAKVFREIKPKARPARGT